jgi:hypothetical protein
MLPSVSKSPAKPRSSQRKVGRKRRSLGLIGLALGVLLAALWVWSGLSRAIRDAGPWCGRIEEGRFIVQWSDGTEPAPPWIPSGPAWIVGRAPFGGWTSHIGAVDPVFKPVGGNTPGQSSIDWWLLGYTHNTSICTFHLALWSLPIAAWIVAAAFLRWGFIARRRSMTDHCAKCGYDLKGLGADAKCPECGRGISPMALPFE